MMIKGFDRAVADMEIGQIKDIHLMPEEAYGLPDPNAIFHVEISQLPGAEELEEGQQVYLQNEMGQPFPVTVVAKEAGIITFDANHEMAGKELNFKIELVEIWWRDGFARLFIIQKFRNMQAANSFYLNRYMTGRRFCFLISRWRKWTVSHLQGKSANTTARCRSSL